VSHDIVALSVERRTYDKEVVGSRLGQTHGEKLWASFSHLRASVTEQYKLVLA